MPRILPAAAGLALLVAPLEAQVGLSSAARTVVLTAVKPGSLGITVPTGGAAPPRGGLGVQRDGHAAVVVETSWDLDPSQTSSVTVVAYVRAPFAAPAGTITAAAELPAGSSGGILTPRSPPVTLGAAAGRRTQQLEARIDLAGPPDQPAGRDTGTLHLLAITQ